MLREIGPEIWTAEGPAVSFFGFAYPTRMVAIRLAGGRLLVWSPIPASRELRDALGGLGQVAFIVSPNFLHNVWLPDWKIAFPVARLFAPPGLQRRRPDIEFAGELSSISSPEWAAEVDQVAFEGSVAMTEIVFLHRASRTAIFGDLLQNFPRDWFPGWRGWIARLDGIVAPNCGAPRDLRLSFLWRERARKSLQKILDFAPRRVVIAHGDMAMENGEAFIRHGFRWLSR